MQTRNEIKYKYQEQSSSRSLLQYRILLRAVTLLHHIVVITYCLSSDLSQTEIPELITIDKYKTRYLTNWNFGMQIIYFALALLCDLLKWTGRDEGTVARKLVKFREFYFTSVIFPYSMVVLTAFWSVFYLNREMILPKVIDKLAPFWIQHSIHTVIGIATIFDLILEPVTRPFDDSTNKITFYFIFVFYHIVLFCTYLEAGFWIYPLLNYFNASQRFMFYLLLFIIHTICYEIQWPLGKWMKNLQPIKLQ